MLCVDALDFIYRKASKMGAGKRTDRYFTHVLANQSSYSSAVVKAVKAFV